MNKFEDYTKKTDIELVNLSLENRDCFVYLIKRYEQKLLRYIMRISGLRKEDAEDVLQDVFIKVYQNLNDFDPELKFSSWIYRIAHNQTISNHRKLKSRPQEISVDDGVFNNFASKLDLEKDVDRDKLKKTVSAVLIEMDEKYREALVLKFMEDKSYQEISDILKKPMGTVATLISRAKDQFRKISEKNQIKL
ncbi:sigma-70 family RNA polymerase sigma factor [bacterium]|nr:MAG: sigma-70 family RNA polymerase sigma factor [bacterium]